MQRYKLANVLLENNPRSINYPALYCRSTGSVFLDRRCDEWLLYGPGQFDFTTFFNSLSTKKWQQYTVVKEFYLHLELKGAACCVYDTHADALMRRQDPNVSDEPLISFEENPDEWQSVDVKLPLWDSDIITAFLIETDGQVYIRNSYYYANLEPTDIRPVELSLVTTTFKKEEFILENIDLVKKEILASDDAIAPHLWMHVVDNGSTLDVDALTTDRVIVHPNINAGGSGGFARGMIESMDQEEPITHVLLMDDDVAVSPESIKRTYVLLTLLNDTYKEAFISGSMMNYEVGDDQWEDLGFMTKEGRFAPVKPGMRMSLLADLVFNEIFEEAEEWVDQTYAAWWYCCIPMAVIKREGMPLPFFVRCDDAEYGIRCHPLFITMNGICIWHMSFHARYNAAVERYQTTRNTLIAQATTGMAPESDFIGEFTNNIRIELKKFNYRNAELVLDGFEDYMRGPDFIGRPVAEECFMRANRKAEKLYSYDELQKQIDESPDLDVDLEELTVFDVDKNEAMSRVEALFDYLTYNGQRLPFKAVSGASVIPAAGWIYPPGKLHGRDVLVAIDLYNRKGSIRRMDKKRFKQVQDRLHRDMRHYEKIKDELNASYAAAREWLTSVEFWRQYLGID